jgi:hypothetical protein
LGEEAVWLNGKMEEITERAEKTIDRDRPSHGRSYALSCSMKAFIFSLLPEKNLFRTKRHLSGGNLRTWQRRPAPQHPEQGGRCFGL